MVASDNPPRQVPCGAVGTSTPPDFSASQAAWPTKVHSHPTAYFIHVLKRATSLGSQNPRVLAPGLCRSPPLGNRLWPLGSNTVSTGAPGGLLGAGLQSPCSRWPAHGHSACSRFSSAQSPSAEGPQASASAHLLLTWCRIASNISLVGLAQPPGSVSVLAAPRLLGPPLQIPARTSSGPWPAPSAGSCISNSAWSPPGQPFPHLPHMWARAPRVSLDRPHPPHRVTTKVPAVASQAGRGHVSLHTPISPWSATPPRPTP